MYREQSDRNVTVAVLVSLPFFALLFHVACSRDDVSIALPLAVDAVLAALVIPILRAIRMGVYLTPEALRIVNIRKTFAVAWAEISDISFGYEEAGIWKDSGVVATVESRRIPMFAIRSPNRWTRPDDSTAQEMVEELKCALNVARENDVTLPASRIELPGN